MRWIGEEGGRTVGLRIGRADVIAGWGDGMIMPRVI